MLTVRILADLCEPCPRNGQCYEGKLECHRGYRRHGNLCIEDGDINQTANKLVGFKNLVHSGILIFLDAKIIFLAVKSSLYISNGNLCLI